MAMRFQRRWMPNDMTSFMTSYLCATESNTAPTRRAFSSQPTCSKPKWVVLSVMSFIP